MSAINSFKIDTLEMEGLIEKGPSSTILVWAPVKVFRLKKISMKKSDPASHTVF